jgi:hypothetical protein
MGCPSASAMRSITSFCCNIVVLLCYLLCFNFGIVNGIGQVIDAVNCGGPEHTDVHGIKYRADPLEGKTGIASDYGRRHLIQRIDIPDQPLYQTERYTLEDALRYVTRVPKDVDGDYVLVLKFSEVYFGGPNLKVFDVVLNDRYEVIKNLDIFSKVGRGTAHDEVIPFQIRNQQIIIADRISEFNGKLVINLKRGSHDNPKINAFYIMKGGPEDVPPLAPLEMPGGEEDDVNEDIESDAALTSRRAGEQQDSARTGERGAGRETTDANTEFASGRKAANPYEDQEATTLVIPILIVIVCAIPAILLLCRLS